MPNSALFRVEKVIKRKKGQVLVKWKGGLKSTIVEFLAKT